MPSPYFTPPWPAFSYQGRSYDLIHLNEAIIQAEDSSGKLRNLIVSFSDHCFTRKPEHGDDPSLKYPTSSRSVGYFCFTRYAYPKALPSLICTAVTGLAWNVMGENFAFVPTVDAEGKPILYGIVFALDRVKGLPADLHMRVRSAYPCDQRKIETFGSIRFAHLITVRLQNKLPQRIVERHRKRPQLRS